jgi:hypothetical protein
LKLNELEEMRLRAYENAVIYKEKTMKHHDKGLVRREFHVGQLVLLFNSRLRIFPGKLKSKWSGRFVVLSISPYRAVDLSTPGEKGTFKVNAQRLKPYLGGDLPKDRAGLVLQDL